MPKDVRGRLYFVGVVIQEGIGTYWGAMEGLDEGCSILFLYCRVA